MRRHCYREARRIGLSRDEAEDVAQDATLRAWRMRRACRAPESPWAWLTQITRNEAYRALSRARAAREIATGELPEAEAPADDDWLVTRVDVERALRTLSSIDRLIVRLRYQADLTHPATAAALGMSVSSVKVRIHRLMPKLKETLQNP